MAPLAQVTTFRMMFLEQRLLEALDVLAEERIRVVLLKGAALAPTAYAAFAERPMSDLDLLIHPKDTLAALRALCSAGWQLPDKGDYSDHHHLPPLDDTRGSGTQLEIHTELFPDGAGFQLPIARVTAKSQEISLHGRAARVPCPSHQVLHLCIHFAWSHTMRQGIWRTLRDLDALIAKGKVDWEDVVYLARNHRATTCCYWTFRLARHLAGIDVPLSVLRRLQPPGSEYLFYRLERNFILEMFSTTAYCPSVLVRHTLWRMAIQPRRAGHGGSVPWSTGVSALPAKPVPVPKRVTYHLREAAQWKSFALGVFVGR
jgi:hypothetical protein